MTRTVTLPLLLALASTVPLAASAQTHAGTNIGVTVDAVSATTTADASSSSSDDQAFQQWSHTERQRIENSRAAANALYDQDQRACWQRFAVNACLDRARERRHATLAVLRHDELALNAQERQRRTAARLDEIARKQAETAKQNRQHITDAPAPPASGAQ